LNWPIHWEKCSVSDVAEVFLGKTPKKSQYLSEGNNKIIKFRDIKQGQVDFDNNKEGFLLNDSNLLKSLRRLNLNDILITSAAHSGENIGKKCAIVKNMPEKYANFYFTGELLNIRSCSDESLAKWLYFFFSSKMGLKEIQKAVSGVHLTSGRAKSMQIVIAPDKERDRIVAKLEKLLAKVEQSQARLDKIPDILKHFRKAVLEAACSGKLTEEWRKQNPNVETGQNLIKKILETKQKGSKKHKNNDVDQVANSDLPNIPDIWGWSYLQNLGQLSRGKSKHRPRNDPKLFGGSYPFIQTGDVANSNGKIKNHTQTYNEIGLAQSRLFPPNTLCITIAANIADTAILAYPAYFPDSIVGFIPEEGLFEVEFAMYFIKTAQNDLSMFAPATAQKNINLAILQKLPIPVPPIEEQKEIVRRVRELFQFADQIEHRYQKAKTHIDNLTQSILAKAFRGELVPQDPNDEPASELLKRIKAEKARQEAENKPNRKPKAKKGRASKKAAV